MACFIIHWCVPAPNNEKYTQTMVDDVKGGKPMDEFVGFKMLTPQIHPHLGGGVLLEEADNLATVQEHTYPWTKGRVSRRQSPLISAMRSMSILKRAWPAG